MLLMVVEGVVVIVNVAVGMLVIVLCGPAIMENFLCQAKSKPSIIIIQLPDSI